MPRVPQYDTPQVQQEGLSLPKVAVEAPIEAFGGGSSANAAFGVAEGLAQKAKERADNIAQAEANTRLNNKITQLMHDKQKGFLNKKGKDVYKGYDEAIKGFDDEAAEIEKGLVGSQKEAFRQRYASVRGDFDRSMQTHINGEMRRYEDEVYKSSQQSELNKAIGSYRDPLAVSNIVQTRRNLTLARQKSLGNLNPDGSPNEIAQAELDEVTSQTHVAVLGSLVNAGDDLAAEKYFKQNENYFYGDDKIRAAKFVEESSRTNKSMRMADEIVGKAKSLNAAYKFTDGIEDGLLRKAVENRVEEIFDRQKKLRAAAKENSNAFIANILENNGGDLEAIPKTVWASLEMEERTRVQAYAKKLRGGAGVQEDDFQLVEEIETLKATNQGRKEFLETDFNSGVYLTSLTPDTRRKYIEEKGKLSKGDKEFNKRLEKLSTERGMFMQEASAAGLKDPEDQLTAKKIYQQQIQELEAQKGKPLTLEEKRIEASKIVAKVEVGKTWYGGAKKKFAYEIKPSDVNVDLVDYEDIPPFALQDIQKYFRSKGVVNPSRQEIVNKYQMDLVRMSGRNLARGNERIR